MAIPVSLYTSMISKCLNTASSINQFSIGGLKYSWLCKSVYNFINY